jgi:uncharacterized tellurite resistance protein B-like protein
LTNVFDSLLADGRADEDELDLFDQMRSAFGVSQAAFKNSVHAITLKNDKTVFGPFDATQSSSSRVSPHLAMAVSLLYMMSADGAIGVEEIGQLEAVIGEFPGLQQVALAYVRKVKRDEFFKAVSPALTASQKLCILTNVCDSMMSDGTAAVVEDKLFVSMVAAFGLQLKDFDKYYQVLEVKNIRPFDTSKFKPSTKHDRVSGEAGEEGDVFEMTGAAAELGIEVRRTMHDNIDRVQHDFGSEENILQVNHNATDDLNIQQVKAGSNDANIQQLSIDASGANLQKVSEDVSGLNLQQVNNGASGVNLQQVNGEQVKGDSAQWIAGAASVDNRQAIVSDADVTELERLAPARQNANVQTLHEAASAANRQALQGAALDANRTLVDTPTAADHLETLPPEERVKTVPRH